MISPPRKIRATDAQLQSVQENIVEVVEQLCRQQILDGVVVTADIGTTPTLVQHKLTRVPVGYIIISKNGPGDVFDSAKDSVTITMQSSSAVRATLWVF